MTFNISVVGTKGKEMIRFQSEDNKLIFFMPFSTSLWTKVYFKMIIQKLKDEQEDGKE